MNKFYHNTDGCLLGVYTAAQVRAMDRYAIDKLGIPGLKLMHRAGESAFHVIRERWPKVRRIVIVCGAGNNAGDGYVVARLAREQDMLVSVLSIVPPEKLSGDAASVYREYVDSGAVVEDFSEDLLGENDLIIDALLGTGLDRDVSGAFAQVIGAINRCEKPVLALDIPSGLNADTGYPMGLAVHADCTVSFIGAKMGLYTGDGVDYAGCIEFSSLDVPESVVQQQTPAASLISLPCSNFKPRPRSAHKGHFGHVLIIGGDVGYSGAAILAARAAARVGAGLISIATRDEHAIVLNLSQPELMCHGVDKEGGLDGLLAKATVVGIGPGLGQSPWAVALFEKVCTSGLPMVVDADALNLLSASPRQNCDWVLTPHPGEAARLLQADTLTIRKDRFQAVISLQEKYAGICILKGAGTLVHDGARLEICPTGNPGMASGGMGDVLTGVIAGLVAQGFSVADASRIGVYIHGAAADLAAQRGERGLLAGDLLPHLRNLVNP